MHLIVPFASVWSEAGRAAAAALELPNLARAWGHLQVQMLPLLPGADAQAPELSLTPPHEQVWAQALGWSLADGQLPWAALEAAEQGLQTASKAWGRLTLAHWQLGTEQLTMLDPAALDLDEASTVVFLEAIRPLFEDEGFELHAASRASQALVSHPSLEGLPCASLDRVAGRNVDLWLPADPRARLMRRLQNEVQMLLHTHPLNEDREQRGALPVNSFWLDGCGVAPAPRPQGTLVIDDRLRSPALNEDWFAWSRAFAQLDEGPLAQVLAAARAGQPVTLSLCGERHACSLTPRPPSLWRGLLGAWPRGDGRGQRAVRALLETL